MQFIRDSWSIFKMELTLFKRFPKLRLSTFGVILIPALYALIYLGSVRDPAAHTGQLKAAIVNLDQGLNYRGQDVNIGRDVIQSVREKQAFNFVDYAGEEEATQAVRQGDLAFALIIPKDFSANAAPGQEVAGGRLVVVVSEGNNYSGAALVKRFASELGRQVNINLNEKRWALVLTTAAGSTDKLAQMRQGVATLNTGAQALDAGVAKAEGGARTLATGATAIDIGVGQLTNGVKQLGSGLHTMDQQRPPPQDLAAMKTGAAELVAGHVALSQGLQELQTGAQKLAEGSTKLGAEATGIPIVGTRIAAGAAQLTDGARQLGGGLQSAQTGQSQLADGTRKLQSGVEKLTDGVAALGAGIHTAASKVPPDAKLDELATGGRALAGGAQELRTGLAQLKAGSKQLAAGLDLLKQSLPDAVGGMDGSARGLADSVEPALVIVAPVVNNGAGYAPNFLATSLWLGAVMTAFLFHLRRLPASAASASAVARLVGKMGILGIIVTAQALVIMVMSLFMLELPVAQLLPFALTLVLGSLTFLTIILALTRAFGDAGKAMALLLMVLQLSSAGGVMPVELSGGIYQIVGPWLPFTWVIKALRASMFNAFDGAWLNAWLIIGLTGAMAWLSACFVGRWRFVPPAEHRPAMDI